MKLEQIATERTRRLAARLEPLVQADVVKELLAGAAGHLGQRVVGAVYDAVADGALLDAGELLVHIALPDVQALNDGAVLVREEGGELEEPVAPLVLAHAQSLHARHLHDAERIVARQLDNELHGQLLHLVDGDHFAAAQHAAYANDRLLVVVLDVLFRRRRLARIRLLHCCWRLLLLLFVDTPVDLTYLVVEQRGRHVLACVLVDHVGHPLRLNVPPVAYERRHQLQRVLVQVAGEGAHVLVVERVEAGELAVGQLVARLVAIRASRRDEVPARRLLHGRHHVKQTVDEVFAELELAQIARQSHLELELAAAIAASLVASEHVEHETADEHVGHELVVGLVSHRVHLKHVVAVVAVVVVVVVVVLGLAAAAHDEDILVEGNVALAEVGEQVGEARERVAQCVRQRVDYAHCCCCYCCLLLLVAGARRRLIEGEHATHERAQELVGGELERGETAREASHQVVDECVQRVAEEQGAAARRRHVEYVELGLERGGRQHQLLVGHERHELAKRGANGALCARGAQVVVVELELLGCGSRLVDLLDEEDEEGREQLAVKEARPVGVDGGRVCAARVVAGGAVHALDERVQHGQEADAHRLHTHGVERTSLLFLHVGEHGCRVAEGKVPVLVEQMLRELLRLARVDETEVDEKERQEGVELVEHDERRPATIGARKLEEE